MRLIIRNQTCLVWPGGTCQAALGLGGLVTEADKREGDGATPIGTYVLRRVMYRADRIKRPKTNLPCRPIHTLDGWCDEPTNPAYNRPVRLPYTGSTEALYRKDHVYDLLVVLGHNDSPPKLGLGSAIFLHLARSNWTPTRGCIAVRESDLREILQRANTTSTITICNP